MPADDTRNSKSDSTNLSPSARRKRRSWRPAALTATVVAVGGAIFARFVDRVDAQEKLARTTSVAAVPSVAVIHPQAGAPNQEIVLPGYAQAFTDTPVYARTNGYLRAWRSILARTSAKATCWLRSTRPRSINSCARHAPIWPPRRRICNSRRSLPRATRIC